MSVNRISTSSSSSSTTESSRTQHAHLQPTGCQITTVLLKGAEATFSLEAAEMLSEIQRQRQRQRGGLCVSRRPATGTNAAENKPASLPGTNGQLFLRFSVHHGSTGEVEVWPHPAHGTASKSQHTDWLKISSYGFVTSWFICCWYWLYDIWTESLRPPPGGDARFTEHVAAVGEDPKGLVFWEVLF